MRGHNRREGWAQNSGGAAGSELLCDFEAELLELRAFVHVGVVAMQQHRLYDHSFGVGRLQLTYRLRHILPLDEPRHFLHIVRDNNRGIQCPPEEPSPPSAPSVVDRVAEHGVLDSDASPLLFLRELHEPVTAAPTADVDHSPLAAVAAGEFSGSEIGLPSHRRHDAVVTPSKINSVRISRQSRPTSVTRIRDCVKPIIRE